MIGNYLGFLQEIQAEEQAKYQEELYFDHLYEEEQKEKFKFLIWFFKIHKSVSLLFSESVCVTIAELYYTEFFDELYVPDPNLGNYYSDDFSNVSVVNVLNMK